MHFIDMEIQVLLSCHVLMNDFDYFVDKYTIICVLQVVYLELTASICYQQ